MKIKLGQLNHQQVLELLEEHLDDMNATSPPESVHALDVSSLEHQSIRFWSGWDEEQLLGCVALKCLGSDAGELKSMRTTHQSRKRGVASALLAHALEQARLIGLKRVSLETGTMDYFLPARALYEKFGFSYCEPFEQYEDDPNSCFMTLELT